MKKILVLCVIVLVLLSLIPASVISYAGFRRYKVQEGDTLYKIAPPAHWKVIMKVNRIDEKHLPLGRYIFIPEATDLDLALSYTPFQDFYPEFGNMNKLILIDIQRQYFAALKMGRLVYWGPICSGSGKKTPCGKFQVLGKDRYYTSKKYKVPMPYAMRFFKGNFIHYQAMTGKRSSKGCIRLLEDDARWLFGWSEIGTAIRIY